MRDRDLLKISLVDLVLPKGHELVSLSNNPQFLYEPEECGWA